MTYVQGNLDGGNLINVSTYMVKFNQQNLAYSTKSEFNTQYNAGNYSTISAVIRNKVFDLNTTVVSLHESDNHTSLPTVSNNEIILTEGKYLLQGCPTLFTHDDWIYYFVASYGFKTNGSFVGFKGINSAPYEQQSDQLSTSPITWGSGATHRYYAGQKYARAYVHVESGTKSYTLETDSDYTGNGYKNPFVSVNDYHLDSGHGLYGNSNFNNNLGAPGKILIFKL